MIQCWDEVTLDEISEDITVGHVGPMANQYVDIGVPFLRSLNVEPFRINTKDLKYIPREFHRSLKKSALKPDNIVIVRTGKPGSCAVVPSWLHEANCSDVVVVRAGPKVRPGYICYVVNSTAAHHIDAHTVGAVQQHFNVGSARQIRFRLPPLAEQDRILSVLGTLDDKIELNRRINETLEAMAGTIFKDWFIDFGPTRAKMEGRAPYLAPETWALFPDRLDGEGKPEGWITASIGSACSRIANGGTPKRDVDEYWRDGTIPWLTSGEVRKPYLIGTDNFITESGLAGSSAKWVDPEATVVALYGATAGQVSFVATRLTTNQAVCALTPRLAFRYFNYLLLSSSTQTLAGMATGSAQQNLSKGLVEELPVTLSDLALMEDFDAALDPWFKRIVANEREVAVLAATRDLLLPKLMSGEIHLREAEKALEAVA
jgi:type I restriction enzyme S subunit